MRREGMQSKASNHDRPNTAPGLAGAADVGQFYFRGGCLGPGQSMLRRQGVFHSGSRLQFPMVGVSRCFYTLFCAVHFWRLARGVDAALFICAVADIFMGLADLHAGRRAHRRGGDVRGPADASEFHGSVCGAGGGDGWDMRVNGLPHGRFFSIWPQGVIETRAAI